MATTREPRRFAHPALRWLVYLCLTGLGLVLFVACGIAGGLAGLNWLV